MSKKVSIKKIIAYSGAFIGYMMGSAFATGQEVLQFFSSFGFWGSLGATFVTGLATIFLAAAIMNDAYKLQLKRPSDLLKYYCGKHVGLVIEVVTMIYLYSLFIVMVAGGGAILNEYYGLNKWIGSIIISLIALIASLCGLKQIVNTLGKIGPFNIIIIVTVSILVIILYARNIPASDEFLLTHEPLKAAKYWWLSGILYPANCTIFMVTFLAAMGTTASNKKEALLSGITGGVLFTIGLLVVSIGIIATLPQVYDLQAPAIGMSELVYPGLGIIYSIAVVLATQASSIPLLWVPATALAPNEKSIKFKLLAILGVIIALAVSQINFSQLINFIIPLAGWIGLIIPVSILMKHLHIKIPYYNTRYNTSLDFDETK